MDLIIFLNCSLQSIFDVKRKKTRVKPADGQNVPMLFVRCSRKQREQIPLGSIFYNRCKIDST